MDIVSYIRLPSKKAEEAKKLYKLCSEADHLASDLFLDPGLETEEMMPHFWEARENDRMISFLTLFSSGKEEVEVTAFTDPAFRKQGYFHSILSQVMKRCREHGYSRILYAVETKSVRGIETVQHLPDTVYAFSEYRMQLLDKPTFHTKEGTSFIPVTNIVFPRYAALLAKLFGEGDERKSYLAKVLSDPRRHGWMACVGDEPIGVCHLNDEGSKCCVYGFELLPYWRGKGYGRLLLEYVTAQAIEWRKQVVLDVESDNIVALTLYRSMGFSEVYEIAYYATELS